MDKVNLKTNTAQSIWWIYTLLLLAITWLYFGNLVHHGLDAHDNQTFRDNLAMAADPLHFFSLDKAQPSGRPTAELFKFAAFLIGGNNPAFFHLLPIGLHLLASLFLARLIYHLYSDLRIGLMTGFLFIIGVSHFQAIHHISALDYPLSLVLALAAALSYLRFVDGRGSRYFIGAIILIALSAGAHISSIVLIFFCFILHRRSIPKPWLWMLAMSLFALPAAMLALTAHTTTTWAALDARRAQDLLTLIPDIAGMYLWLLSRLFTTAYWHPVAATSTQPWEFYVGGCLLLGMAWLVWKKHLLAPWIAWALLSLAPFALITWDIVFLLPSGASRYLYLASVPTAFASAWALNEIRRLLAAHTARAHLAPYGVAFLLSVTSYFSLQQTEALSLYSSARSYVARGDSETGVAVLKQLFTSPHRGAVPEDEAYFLLCSAMPFLGEDPTPYLNIARIRFPEHLGLQTIAAALAQQAPGQSLRQLGEQQMQALYEQATARGEDQYFLRNLAAIYHNIGLGHIKHGDFAAAETMLQRTLQIHPDRANTRRILNRTYVQWAEALAEQRQDPVAILQRGVLFDPHHVATRLALGEHFFRLGAWTEASVQYRSILEIEQHSLAWFNLGLAELKQGRAHQGRRTIQQALAVFGFTEAKRVGAIAQLEKMMDQEGQNLIVGQILDSIRQFQ